MDFNTALITAEMLVLTIFDWVAVLVLHSVSKGQGIRALVSRTRVALLIALFSTVIAFLGINRGLHLLTDEESLLLFAIVIALPSLGNLWFLVDLWRGKFRDG